MIYDEDTRKRKRGEDEDEKDEKDEYGNFIDEEGNEA